MDGLVFAAVLFAAACHAGWNAAIKFGLDPIAGTALIAMSSGIFGALAIGLTGLPELAAWPYIVASVIVHLFYFIGLAESYRFGDLGQVYPLARGAAPLMTAALSLPLVGEAVAPLAFVGIIALAMGVLLISLRGGRALARFDPRAVGLALFTAVTITAYTLVDGLGGRAAGNPHAYTAIMFAGNGVLVAAYAMLRRGPGVLNVIAKDWRKGAVAGSLQLASYGIAIWAMTVAPIAMVAALRETSVLFGAAISVALLGEPVRPVRIAAAVIIVAGLALLRLA